eukprot:m.97443 g.97443  ORF g.97443 m.97443 type:complete len:88 (-) comp26978_c0_seq1:1953-2216(-)
MQRTAGSGAPRAIMADSGSLRVRDMRVDVKTMADLCDRHACYEAIIQGVESPLWVINEAFQEKWSCRILNLREGESRQSGVLVTGLG